jgi:hypothetical protein
MARALPRRERIGEAELAKQVNLRLAVLRRATEEGRVPRAALIGRWYSYEIRAITRWVSKGGPDAIRPKSSARRGFVYVAAAGDPVKIGFAANVRQRLQTLQTSCPFPLRLLHSAPATTLDEKRLHARFKPQRAIREWFRLESDLSEWIEAGCPHG